MPWTYLLSPKKSSRNQAIKRLGSITTIIRRNCWPSSRDGWRPSELGRLSLRTRRLTGNIWKILRKNIISNDTSSSVALIISFMAKNSKSPNQRIEPCSGAKRKMNSLWQRVRIWIFHRSNYFWKMGPRVWII